MKKPTHEQMMKRPSLWYCDWLDCMKIVYPDITTQENYGNCGEHWTHEINSTGVIRTHYYFLGWL